MIFLSYRYYIHHTLYILFNLMLTATIQAQTSSMPEWDRNIHLPDQGGREHPGLAGPLTGFHGGVLIIAGGANFPDGYPWQGGAKRYHQNIYTWDPGDETQSSCFLQQSITLPEPLAYAACISTSQGIVCAGGENAKGLSDQVYLLRWQQKSRNLQISTLPGLPQGLTNAMLAELDGKLFLAGGETDAGTSDKLYVLSWQDTARGWQLAGQLPTPLSTGVWLAEQSMNANRIWLIGGRTRQASGITAFSDQVFAYDIITGKWSREGALPYALAAGTGVVCNNASIFLFGGDRGQAYNRTEELILNEKSSVGEIEKERARNEKRRFQEAHPGFSRELLRYNKALNQWQILGDLPFATPVTTYALLYNDCIYIPSGEIRAGLRSPIIRIGKMPGCHE